MIIKLSAFALVSIVLLCETVPVSVAAGDSDGQSSQEELSVMRNNLMRSDGSVSSSSAPCQGE